MEPSPTAHVSQTDEEIVHRVLAGEPAQFEVLMRRHNPRVYRVARAILGNEADVEDVMQDTYLNAYSHLAQFAGRARFSTWLMRIAAHAASARGRRTVRDLFAAHEAADEAAPGASGAVPLRDGADRDGLDPERHLLQGEVRALLDEALDALPPDSRAVFVLREVEGLDTSEVAQALGVSEEAVRTRLLRARGTLRRDLSRSGVESADAYRLHLDICNRVVGSVLPRLPQAPAGSPPPTG